MTFDPITLIRSTCSGSPILTRGLSLYCKNAVNLNSKNGVIIDIGRGFTFRYTRSILN